MILLIIKKGVFQERISHW